MYITRDRHAKTLPLIPAYVAAGQHKALVQNRQRINTLELELSRCNTRIISIGAALWSGGFLCGLLASWLR